MNDIIQIAKAISDKNRFRALMMLTKEKLCLCQIIEMLSLAPSTVSKHMSVQAGLAEAIKKGKWVYYQLPKPKSECLSSDMIQLLKKWSSDDEQINSDKFRLLKVTKKKLEFLCRAYKK